MLNIKRHVTSPIWGLPPPFKQALSVKRNTLVRVKIYNEGEPRDFTCSSVENCTENCHFRGVGGFSGTRIVKIRK